MVVSSSSSSSSSSAGNSWKLLFDGVSSSSIAMSSTRPKRRLESRERGFVGLGLGFRLLRLVCNVTFTQPNLVYSRFFTKRVRSKFCFQNYPRPTFIMPHYVPFLNDTPNRMKKSHRKRRHHFASTFTKKMKRCKLIPIKTTESKNVKLKSLSGSTFFFPMLTVLFSPSSHSLNAQSQALQFNNGRDDSLIISSLAQNVLLFQVNWSWGFIFKALPHLPLYQSCRMEEENQESTIPASSHPTLINTHRSDSTPSTTSSDSSSSSSSEVHEGVNHQHHHQHHQQPQQERRSFYYRVNFTVPNVVFSDSADDVWSSLGIVVTFWFFASIFLIIGFYGSVNLQLSSNYSRLLLANPLFVNEIKVEDMTKAEPGLTLYGFNEVPPLGIETTWSEAHDATLPTHSHKEWLYYLNEGSEVNITYNVKSQSSQLYLAIAQGKENLLQWLREPTYPNITIVWDIIHGNGMVQQKISTASDYYVIVGNLNQEEIEVQLNFRIRAILYNTTDSYFKCSLAHGACGLKLYLTKKSVAVITAPGPPEGKPMDEMYVRLSYDPRWISYFIGSGVMTLLILLVSKICAKYYPISGNGVGPVRSERTPLLVPKDEDLLSLGSSYDSVSNDEADIEEWFIAAKELGGEDNGSPRLVCLVCFDTPRDCFFLPCGHSATCFPCGSRIAEDEAGTCPICHRKMKKVRRIITV